MFPRILRFEIGLLLAVKVAALAALYYLLIAPAVVPVNNGETVSAHLLGVPPMKSVPYGSR
jgi:hypothetical protein